MACLVTAGPSYEPFDEVRRLTNFSTGTLGAELANFLVDHGHAVLLLLGHYSTYQGEHKAQQIIRFTTGEDLRGKLQALRKLAIGAVFHAAAVCDFAPGKIWTRLPAGELEELHARKISSRENSLFAELIPTPKILGSLRAWFPKAQIVGWKYEVDGERASVLSAARQQISDNETDGCVANGPAYGEGFGFLNRTGILSHLMNSQALFELLARQIAPR